MKDKNYIPITQSLIHAIMQSLISLFTQSLIHTIMQSLISLLSHKGQNGAGVLVGGEQKAALVEPRQPFPIAGLAVGGQYRTRIFANFLPINSTYK